jgi:hypothetical protein
LSLQYFTFDPSGTRATDALCRWLNNVIRLHSFQAMDGIGKVAPSLERIALLAQSHASVCAEVLSNSEMFFDKIWF